MSHLNKRLTLVLLAGIAHFSAPLSAESQSRSLAPFITPLPDKVACAMVDRQDFQIPDRVQLTGWLGTRITVNESNRLAKIETGRLLEGYRQRPGRQTWEGEQVGELTGYPNTTAADRQQLKPRQKFTLSLSNPEKVLAVRVIGVPAGGDNPQQAFSSCAEIQASEN